MQEHYENETVTVDETEIGHIINLYGCKGTTVIVKGKINAATMGQSFMMLDLLLALTPVPGSELHKDEHPRRECDLLGVRDEFTVVPAADHRIGSNDPT